MIRDGRSIKKNGGMTNVEFIATFLHHNPGARWVDIKRALVKWRYDIDKPSRAQLGYGNVYLQRPLWNRFGTTAVCTVYAPRLWRRIYNERHQPRWFLTFEGLCYVRHEVAPHWSKIL